MEDRRIIDCDPPICLYCGEFKKDFSSDRDIYYECDCEDALKEQEIMAQVHKLYEQLPKVKFKIVKREFLIDKRL